MSNRDKTPAIASIFFMFLHSRGLSRLITEAESLWMSVDTEGGIVTPQQEYVRAHREKTSEGGGGGHRDPCHCTVGAQSKSRVRGSVFPFVEAQCHVKLTDGHWPSPYGLRWTPEIKMDIGFLTFAPRAFIKMTHKRNRCFLYFPTRSKTKRRRGAHALQLRAVGAQPRVLGPYREAGLGNSLILRLSWDNTQIMCIIRN